MCVIWCVCRADRLDVGHHPVRGVTGKRASSGLGAHILERVDLSVYTLTRLTALKISQRKTTNLRYEAAKRTYVGPLITSVT